jgi:hypothetical protein
MKNKLQIFEIKNKTLPIEDKVFSI